ncbi:hypothetical protein MTBUT4_660013 [Magnetospirillum sp. UT-4]|nr:hypothetical protein MTBUT4_660013 [Magnetospirillum sp. UT-4]
MDGRHHADPIANQTFLSILRACYSECAALPKPYGNMSPLYGRDRIYPITTLALQSIQKTC